MEIVPELYPLTGLQIGDIQSYVSRAFIYFAPITKKVLILVDNQPWLMNNPSRSAKIWQLMVTKYRMSPFTNTRALQKASNRKESENENSDDYQSNFNKSKRFNLNRWFPAIDSSKWQEKYLSPVMDLSKALHGFIVFEVAWIDVHGINYYSELQMDTTLALEVKSMKKWEFYSPDQASRCIDSWFSGKPSEIQSLKKNLRLLSDLDLPQWNAHSSSVLLERLSHSRSPSDEDFVDVKEFPLEIDDDQKLEHKNVYGFNHISVLKCRGTEQSEIASTQYADMLILFRFSDSILPVKLRQVIMPDLRLLTLLEAGLPSWVIFFQSYPLFCHFYRPWMRHLVRTLYILISLVTVIIGFYDLYKNVPLLKETASRLGGPLFVWIERWDMVSRIRYLGTMLFLQNLEKALKWFMIMSRSIKLILSAIIRPLLGPLSGVIGIISPLWSVCAGTVELLSSTVWLVIESIYSMFLDCVEVVLWPFELLFLFIWSVAKLVLPTVCSIWKLLLVPFRCLVTLAEYMSRLLSQAFDLLKNVWQSASVISEVKTLSEAKQGAYDISVWQSLWDDLFSQVFRAARTVINGLAAFCIACNRHRLSIYNHLVAFLQQLAHKTRLARHTCPCRQKPRLEHHPEDHQECDRCK